LSGLRNKGRKGTPSRHSARGTLLDNTEISSAAATFLQPYHFQRKLALVFIPKLVCYLFMRNRLGQKDSRAQACSVEIFESRTKFDLAAAINKTLGEQRVSQAQASTILKLPQPKISALANYRLDGFSVQRLLRILNTLGRDVFIQVGKKKAGSTGKTSVIAA
jgi:predicted XRE-type DNA-binding protein